FAETEGASLDLEARVAAVQTLPRERDRLEERAVVAGRLEAPAREQRREVPGRDVEPARRRVAALERVVGDEGEVRTQLRLAQRGEAGHGLARGGLLARAGSRGLGGQRRERHERDENG